MGKGIAVVGRVFASRISNAGGGKSKKCNKLLLNTVHFLSRVLWEIRVGIFFVSFRFGQNLPVLPVNFFRLSREMPRVNFDFHSTAAITSVA